MNVYSFPLNAPEKATAVTAFSTHPVRFLSVAENGTLCFTYDGAIYTQPNGSTPKMVDIDVVADDENIPASLSYSRGATGASVSPDGKQVAFVVRGNVFVTSVEYGTTKQISDTPEAEAGVEFGTDNRSLVYASERDGAWNIYTAKILRDDDLNFPNATLIEETALFPADTINREVPKFSPDGKEIAYIENDTKLMVYNTESKTVRQVTDGSLWYSGAFNYEWSPDGKWFTLEIIGNGHDPYSDIAIVKADGKSQPVNITNSGYFNMMPHWVLDGNAILFMTDRYGMRSHASWGSLNDVMLVFLNQDAFDKYRLNKEDYELLKELEKEQAKAKKAADEKADKKNKKKKDKKDEQIEELNDRLKRQMAEFENFRKRSEKEKSQMFDMGAKTIVEKILPVIDNFERGLAAVPDDKKDDPFITGMDKVYKQMLTELDAAGVKPIECVGQEFDPDFHNAVMQVENDELESGTVAQELQKGYMYKDSVVRHSMVSVVQ